MFKGFKILYVLQVFTHIAEHRNYYRASVFIRGMSSILKQESILTIKSITMVQLALINSVHEAAYACLGCHMHYI